MKNPIFAEGAGYVRGRFVPIAEAVLPVTDWGFTRSDVVYDVVHVFKGGFFRLADHLDRFERSMAQRRIRPPEDRAAIEAILHRCVALTGLIDAYVAMVASRGRPRVAGSRRPADCENHLIAYALPWIDVVPKDVQARGAHVWVASTPRVPDASVDPTVKNYQWNDLTSGLLEAHDADFDTAVLCDTQGFLTEGPGFNIFLVKDGRVTTSIAAACTASRADRCWSSAPNSASRPRLNRFPDRRSTTRTRSSWRRRPGVTPASRIGAHILGNDRPGPIPMLLRDTYWRKHEEGWHRTPVRALEAEAGE